MMAIHRRMYKSTFQTVSCSLCPHPPKRNVLGDPPSHQTSTNVLHRCCTYADVQRYPPATIVHQLSRLHIRRKEFPRVSCLDKGTDCSTRGSCPLIIPPPLCCNEALLAVVCVRLCFGVGGPSGSRNQLHSRHTRVPVGTYGADRRTVAKLVHRTLSAVV